MSVIKLAQHRDTPVIHGVDDLCRLLQIPFSDQQLAAITAPMEPGVIIAGAGSGKTTVMAARVVWLVGTGVVRPEEVLGLTFTRKAAAELSARVRNALVTAGVVDTEGVDESGEQLIMTYDAFAARLVTDHGLRIGVDADPSMITGATRHRLASRVVASAAGPFENISRLRPATVTDRVLQLDQEMQQHLVGMAELERHAWQFGQELDRAPRSTRGQVYKDLRGVRERLDERLELASLAIEYAALKRRLGVVEFADQMSVAAELARRVPEVSAQLRAAYKVVLLDEYQDTSSAQALMLQGLFSGRDAEDGRGHPVTAVGDPFQAIYGWRGAAASNITGFDRDFPRSDDSPATTFSLTVNRRSGQTILDVANVLAEPLRASGAAGEPTEDRNLVAGEGAGAAEVHAATFSTWPEEVTWICDRIVNLGPPVDTPGTRRTARPVAEGEAAAVERWSDLAVLTRRNADVAEIYAELSARDVPAEIVGLGGLLHLPEVADVIATLRVTDDVTANPELIRLLSGPRWAIGARDLALLGKRARALARDVRGADASAEATVLDDLADAVAEVDPTEVVSLLDALESPGDLPYGVGARERFGQLAQEFTTLRRHADEPVLDLTRRVITMLGLDVELAATPEFARSNRRDQLATFVDAVADYVDVDGDASLGGLLSWLQAEIDSGVGLERAVPTDQDSVKLLTVHKAKGLEWTAVFLPSLVEGTFPSDRVTNNWLTNAAVVPNPLRGDRTAIPQVANGISIEAYRSFADDLKTEARRAEDRLAYVAATRARRMLIGSGHHWRPDTIKPRVLSPYLAAILDEAERQGRVAERAPEVATKNPLITEAEPVTWPRPRDGEALERRLEAAEWVEQARAGGPVVTMHDDQLLLDQYARVQAWDADSERLLAEARQSRSRRHEVTMPTVASASDWMRATADPEAYASELLRPMPRRPSRAARFGTRFHRWVEHHFGATSLVDTDEVSSADTEEYTDADLVELCESFAEGQFGERPPYRIEAPFEFALDGRTIRGRIDAVYAEPDGRWLVVDWKTSRARTADPLQLAIYRLAWAELQGVDPSAVDAAFHFVRSDMLVRPPDLPDRDGLVSRLATVWQEWPVDG